MLQAAASYHGCHGESHIIVAMENHTKINLLIDLSQLMQI